MLLASKARPIWNGGDKFQVTMTEGGHEIVCDLKNHTCACRKWQLTGIPCFHAIACIYFQKKNPLDYLHECYKKEWYLRVYSHILEPISGEEFWEEPQVTPILPPTVKVAPGRPKKKRDKKNDGVQPRDADPTRLKRVSTKGKCKGCGQEGHNIRTCKSKVTKNISFIVQYLLYCTMNSFIFFVSQVGDQQQKGQEVHDASPATVEQLPAKTSTETTTHAGVLKPFKAPSQTVLGVESVKGQKFTTLTNLHAAIDKKKKQIKGQEDR